MKREYLLVVLIFISFISCEDSVNGPSDDSALIYLNGKISNYQPDGVVRLRMERDFIFTPGGQVDSIIVIDSTIIKSDGSFSLRLSKPPDVLLQPKNGLQCAGLVFSDDQIRTYPHNTFRLYKNNQLIGFIYCAEQAYGNDYYVGEYVTTLMYSEDTLKVSGSCRGQGGNRQVIDNINLNMFKGWNLLVKTITEYTDSTLISESIINNNFRGNWIFEESN